MAGEKNITVPTQELWRLLESHLDLMDVRDKEVIALENDLDRAEEQVESLNYDLAYEKQLNRCRVCDGDLR